MELLITPAQVAAQAFRAPDLISEEAIPEATILAAQQKFIHPVLGDALCTALAAGSYPSLLEDFIKPALALYVKMMMMPVLAVQTGVAGVVEANSRTLARAAETKMRNAIRQLHGNAGVLMIRAMRHIEANPKKYPEYNRNENIMHRVSIEGGLVLD